MDMNASQAVALTVCVVATWRLLRFVRARRSLSHIPGPPATSWWKGCISQLYDPDGWKFHEKMYRDYGAVVRLDMLFGEQQLYVSDPLALHHILIKDQDIFEESEETVTLMRLVMGPSLISTHGEAHAKQRKMLNPVFSLKHMRDLIPICYPITHKLCDVLGEEVAKGKEHVDVMNWMSRAALEFVSQGGFGYSFSALDGQQTNEYSEALKRFIPTVISLGLLRHLLPLGTKIGPAWLRRRIVELVPIQSVGDLVAVSDTIGSNTTMILQNKRAALEGGDEAVQSQTGKGKDILNVLKTLNRAHSAVKATSVPEEELLGHMSIFILAGHDTTTSALSRILHILSQHQDVQSRLREEVTAARNEHGDLDYDRLMALLPRCYLSRDLALTSAGPDDQSSDAVVPVRYPIKSTDGKTEIREIHVTKNTIVHISILGANRNKAVWGEDADEWKPERWLKPLPKSVDDAHYPGVYSQMMTFLGGKRACIGFKFSEMEMKMVLSMILERFIFEPDAEITWEMGGIHHPVVKDSGFKTAQVPLKVSLVHK